MTSTVTQFESVHSTHPWLKFTINLSDAPVGLWVNLGECQSKCEHIAGTPLRPETADQFYRLFLAKGALATTAIEGNTLSEDEVRRHLQGELTVPPSKEYLVQEIDNIVEACNWIAEQVAEKQFDVTVELLRQLNTLVLRNLALDPEVSPGEVRKHQVGVGRYKAPAPEHCAFLLEKLVNWLSSETFAPRPGMAIATATLKAIVAHLYLAWIHPFGDGNGRTARLVEFVILLCSGVPAPACHLLSNHYNQTRTEYYRQLDAASRTGGGVIPFVQYAITGFVDGLRAQIRLIRDQQLDIVWGNYIHDTFRDREGVADRRRKHLVLDLSREPRPVPYGGLMLLTTRLAKAYANRTKRTLNRDIVELLRLGLVQKTPVGLRAKKELIEAFLPLCKQPTDANRTVRTGNRSSNATISSTVQE